MKKIVSLSIVILLASTSASWAWVRGGFGGGWHGGGWGRGGGLRVDLGVPGPGWWGYPDYAYDPYYPYYAAPAPYAPAPVYYDPAAYPTGEAATIQDPDAEASASDTARYNLKSFNDQIARARQQLDYQYADGDISKDQENAGLRYLNQLVKEAHKEASANGGYLTGDQQQGLLQAIRHPDLAPHFSDNNNVVQRAAAPSPRGDIAAINDLLLELRSLLDQKLKDGAITKAQHDGEADYLAQIEKQAQADAGSNGGHISDQQENTLTQQLHRAYYAINHNLIVH